MVQSVKDVMTTDLVSCASSTPLADAAKLMRDRDIGDVLVREGNELRGIVTDRDIVVRCLARGGDLSQATLADACSADLATIEPDMSFRDAAKMMRDRAIRRLPVVQDGKPVGIVSIGDLAVTGDPKSALGGISASAPNT